MDGIARTKAAGVYKDRRQTIDPERIRELRDGAQFGTNGIRGGPRRSDSLAA